MDSKNKENKGNRGTAEEFKGLGLGLKGCQNPKKKYSTVHITTGNKGETNIGPLCDGPCSLQNKTWINK